MQQWGERGRFLGDNRIFSYYFCPQLSQIIGKFKLERQGVCVWICYCYRRGKPMMSLIGCRRTEAFFNGLCRFYSCIRNFTLEKIKREEGKTPSSCASKILTKFCLFHISFKAYTIVPKYRLKNNDKSNETEERSICTTLCKNCSFASKSWNFKETLCSVFKQYSAATNRLGEKHPLIIE